MNTNTENRQHLRKMLDAIINEDMDTAKTAFHDYVVNRSKTILEMDCCDPVGGTGTADPKSAKGSSDVKASMSKTAKDEIAKKGEAKADPKAAKGSKDVKSTMKRGKAIPKKGEAKSDPKAAKGSKDVEGTMKKADDKNITGKKN